MLSFKVYGHSLWWQLAANVCITLLLWVIAAVNGVHIYALVALAIVLIYFSILLAKNWRTRNDLLYLSLDHIKNQIIVTTKAQRTTFAVEKGSRANGLGVWLALSEIHSQQGTSAIKKEFIARWQLNERGFRALHRHLIWYTE